jgi:hypothetical protein
MGLEAVNFIALEGAMTTRKLWQGVFAAFSIATLLPSSAFAQSPSSPPHQRLQQVSMSRSARSTLTRRFAQICGLSQEQARYPISSCPQLQILKNDIRAQARRTEQDLVGFYRSLPRPSRAWLRQQCQQAPELVACLRRKLSTIPPETYEGSSPPYQMGVASEWLRRAQRSYSNASFGAGICSIVSGAYRVSGSEDQATVQATGTPVPSDCRANFDIPAITAPEYRPTMPPGFAASGDPNAVSSSGGRPVSRPEIPAYADCPYMDRFECVGGVPLTTSQPAWVALTSAQQTALDASSEILSREAGLFLLRSGTIGYLRQVLLYGEVTRQSLREVGESLSTECASAGDMAGVPALEIQQIFQRVRGGIPSDDWIREAREEREIAVSMAASRLLISAQVKPDVISG